MAQTTGAMSMYVTLFELSADGTTFVDVSGQVGSIAVTGGDRNSGEAYTASGDTPIIKSGKRTPIDITYRGVYTETTAEFWWDSLIQYELAGGQYYARWSPGGTTGDFQYTTSAGIVTSFQYPQGEVETGEPILVELTIRCAVITDAAIA